MEAYSFTNVEVMEHQKLIIGIVIGFAVGAGAGYWAGLSFGAQRTPETGPQIESSANVNPLENVKANPLKDVKTNPFE